MNFPLLLRLLGTICLLIGGSMLASLPFAVPLFANRTDLEPTTSFETEGAIALIESFLICMVTGGVLRWIG
ncbi:MAG: TrkH family potassium uptake protein, partial [Rubripirellula sp.]